ncbi:ECF transporter S component [Propionibacteriaceae bacterium G1746]
MSQTRTARPAPAMALSARTWVMVAIAAVLAVITFCWPLFLAPGSALTTNDFAPMLLIGVVGLVVAVITAQVTGEHSDVKALALLGVMSAVVAGVRPLGAGTAGLETVFFPIILSGRVFGPGFGFVLGNTGLFASALLTGGVGPWLPFQMLAAGLVGLGAGLLPQWRGALEVVLLVAYGAVASFAYGWLMDFSFWPFAAGGDSQISYDPSAGPGGNLVRFFWFNVATSMGWNLGRAVMTGALLLVLGPPLLRVLRRAARRASFGRASAGLGSSTGRAPGAPTAE